MFLTFRKVVVNDSLSPNFNATPAERLARYLRPNAVIRTFSSCYKIHLKATKSFLKLHRCSIPHGIMVAIVYALTDTQSKKTT